MTRHMLVRQIASADPKFTRVVTTRLNLLGWQSTRFNVDLDRGKLDDDTRPPHALDGAGKRLTRGRVNAMASWREAT